MLVDDDHRFGNGVEYGFDVGFTGNASFVLAAARIRNFCNCSPLHEMPAPIKANTTALAVSAGAKASPSSRKTEEGPEKGRDQPWTQSTEACNHEDGGHEKEIG